MCLFRSNSCFMFVKSCVTPCNAVDSNCISCFVYMHALAGNTNEAKLSALFKFLVQRKRVFVKKPLISVTILNISSMSMCTSIY